VLQLEDKGQSFEIRTTYREDTGWGWVTEAEAAGREAGSERTPEFQQAEDEPTKALAAALLAIVGRVDPADAREKGTPA
jgi:hypothetical protein